MKGNPEFVRIYRSDPLNLTRELPVCVDVDKSEMHEVRTNGGETNLMAMLEDMGSLKKYYPEKLQDDVFMTAFKHKYKCFVTECYVE